MEPARQGIHRAATPAVSVVIPAYHEEAGISRVLDRLVEGISLEFEILVVVDDPDDTTHG